MWWFTTRQLVGDVNDDGKVDEDDLEIMSSEWLSDDMSAQSNLDFTCYVDSATSAIVCVDFEDYTFLARDWKISDTSAASAVANIGFGHPLKRHLAGAARRSFCEFIKRQIEKA